MTKQVFSRIKEKILGATYILNLQWNGKSYETEVRKPGLLSRDPNFYFSVPLNGYETIRTFLEHVKDIEGPLHTLVSGEKRVLSNGGHSKFNIGNDGCDRLLNIFEVIEKSIKSKPRNSKHKGLNENNIFEKYNEDVMGIRRPTLFPISTPKRPPELKRFGYQRKRKTREPVINLTKKV
jgi:hypothetical protein